MVAATRGRPRSFDRDAALDKAVRLFWRQGYQATSIRDLTTELGISPPSLYSAFGDKQQLFVEAVEMYVDRYGGFIDEAVAEEPTAREAVARLLREGPQRYTRQGLPRGCLVVSGDAGTTNADVTAEMSRRRADSIHAVEAKIQTDVDRGTVPADTDSSVLALFAMSLLNGIAALARDGVSRDDLRRVSELALAVWPNAK